MRRVHLRGHHNILKRVLLHAGALNLGLLMRTLFGVGTPRGLQGRVAAIFIAVYSFTRLSETFWTLLSRLYRAAYRPRTYTVVPMYFELKSLS